MSDTERPIIIPPEFARATAMLWGEAAIQAIEAGNAGNAYYYAKWAAGYALALVGREE